MNRTKDRTNPGDPIGAEGHQPDQLLIEPSAAAQRLSISPRKLWELTKRDAIPSKRIDRSVRYSPRDLEEWIDAGCPTEPGAAKRLKTRHRRWSPT